MRTLLLAAALVSAHAFAEGYTSPEVFHFSLDRGQQVGTAAEGDLDVATLGVTTKYGVKRMSRDGDFQRREVTVVGEGYLIKDGRGSLWRMWVRPAIGVTATVMQVELVRIESAALPANQSFHASSVCINDSEVNPVFPSLRLFADGTYRLGHAMGRYVRDEGGLTLDGGAGGIGRGTFSLDGDKVVFKYLRGQAKFEIHYALNPAAVAAR